jgi:hypothetical protein
MASPAAFDENCLGVVTHQALKHLGEARTIGSALLNWRP